MSGIRKERNVRKWTQVEKEKFAQLLDNVKQHQTTKQIDKQLMFINL